MKDLVQNINDNVFEQNEIDESIVEEYYRRNERKKEDEKWLKKYKPLIIKGLEKLGKQKADFGDNRASISIPDNSYFDNDLVEKFLKEKGLWNLACKEVLDEEKLKKLIEEGEVDISELKEYAWVEKKGTPRLIIKKVKKID